MGSLFDHNESGGAFPGKNPLLPGAIFAKLIRMAEEPSAPHRKYELKPAVFERLNVPPSDPARPTTPDVFTLQRDLREREIAAGLDALAPPRRAQYSRRKRDFWLMLLLIDGPLGTATWFARNDPIALVLAGSGLVLTTIGLIWVMWFVMSDY